LPPLPAGPRQETAVVALDGEVWVMGGFDDVGEVVDIIEIFDPTAGTWRAGPALPMPMHHANAVVVQDRLLLLGFLQGLSFEARGETFAWSGESWSSLAPLPLPRARGASAIGAIDAGAIVCGGFRGGAVPDCDRYDASTDTWEPLLDLPAIRDHVVGGVVDDRFFVVGGREGTIASIGGDVWELDPAASAFIPRRSMETPRAGCAAAVLDGRIFVAGGEGNPDDVSGVFAQLEVYDPSDDTWSQLPPMPTPRHGTGAAAVDGMLIIPGGADVAAFSAVDVVEAYVP
jgi:N-acetylneuraminic acid mutarotase